MHLLASPWLPASSVIKPAILLIKMIRVPAHATAMRIILVI